ncbi:MAG: hypothetical protein JM58_07735 [Peptococcaceae bacterium BICA1-8]|nr:MAG: hypothetical protein JM58_07735 [Peptococcaceae bacterium BICA1-8]
MLRKVYLLLLAVFFSSVPFYCFAAEATVTHYYGSSEEERLDEKLSFPYGISLDIDGNLLIADSYNNAIKKISGDELTTIAGFSDTKDSFGYAQGGYIDGNILEAKFNRPRDIVVDSKGNIFVTDTDNHVIRKISQDKVTTFAGIGEPGYTDGLPSEAQFNTPSGIVIDKDDNLYVADTLNNIIRKIDSKGIVKTLAGIYSIDGGFRDGLQKEALFNEPSDLVLDKDNNLYILDSGNQLVRKISGDKVLTLAGRRISLIPDTNYVAGDHVDGNGQNAHFNFPKGLDIAEDGTIFIADTWNNRVRVISPDNEVFTLIGTERPGEQDGSRTDASLNGPVDVLYSNGQLFISDMWNNSIRVVAITLEEISEIKNINKNNIFQGIDFPPPTEEIQVFINKRRVSFSDLKPFISDDKAMIPLMDICEELGLQLKRHEQENKIELVNAEINLSLFLDIDPLEIYNQSIFTHVRFLAEKLNYRIEWVPEYRSIVILTN